MHQRLLICSGQPNPPTHTHTDDLQAQKILISNKTSHTHTLADISTQILISSQDMRNSVLIMHDGAVSGIGSPEQSEQADQG